MRNETFGLAVTIGALLACAGAESTRIARDTYSVECKRKRGNCYEEAARVCPHGFDVLDGSDQRGAVIVANQYSPNTATATVVPTYNGELLVKCHRPNEQAAAPQAAPAPQAAAPSGGSCQLAGSDCNADADCCDGLSCFEVASGDRQCLAD